MTEPAATTPPLPSRGTTPIPVSPRTRTVLLVVGLVVLVLLFRAAPILLVLLLGGATLALILSFPVQALAKRMPRKLAIALVFLLALLLIVVALVLAVPALLGELGDLATRSPQLASEAEGTLRRALRWLWERGLIPAEPAEMLDRWRQGLFDRAQTIARSVLQHLLPLLSGAFNAVILIFGMVFIAVYLLADLRRFKARYLRALPHAYRDDGAELWNALGTSLSRYLGGLLVSIVLQGVMAALALWALGVPYAFLLGFWMTITAVLPYVGAWLGAIPAVLVAFTVSPLTAGLTLLVYVVINQIEGNFLTPRIQGQAVRVHPVLIFLGVIAGGELAGLLGAVFAVPALAVLRVLYDFFAARLVVK